MSSGKASSSYRRILGSFYRTQSYQKARSRSRLTLPSVDMGSTTYIQEPTSARKFGVKSSPTAIPMERR
jgi:hypothetical protein